jgi:hypothetical protein
MQKSLTALGAGLGEPPGQAQIPDHPGAVPVHSHLRDDADLPDDAEPDARQGLQGQPELYK